MSAILVGSSGGRAWLETCFCQRYELTDNKLSRSITRSENVEGAYGSGIKNGFIWLQQRWVANKQIRPPALYAYIYQMHLINSADGVTGID